MQQALNKHGLLPNLSNQKPQEMYQTNPHAVDRQITANNAIKFNQFQ